MICLDQRWLNWHFRALFFMSGPLGEGHSHWEVSSSFLTPPPGTIEVSVSLGRAPIAPWGSGQRHWFPPQCLWLWAMGQLCNAGFPSEWAEILVLPPARDSHSCLLVLMQHPPGSSSLVFLHSEDIWLHNPHREPPPQ